MKKKRFTVLWVAVAIFVVGVFGSILADNFGGDSNAKSTSKVEGPTDPQTLAATLQMSDDVAFKDPNSYRRLNEADFKKFMYPSGDLVGYPYPYVGSRIVIYGRVDELAPNFGTATDGTYFEATTLYKDLGSLVGWSLDSRDLSIVGTKVDLGSLKKGDILEIFAEVRRPYLTGEKVFGDMLRDPFLVAHIVRVLR